MSLASVGNAIVETHGIPIGGFMSKACCSLVLGAAEDVWVRRGLANKRGYIPESTCWSDHVVSARYVDDTLMMSRVMCKDCMLKALTELTHVKFDPVDCDRNLPWLDLNINLDTVQITVLEKPFATAPPWSLRPRDLRSYVLGRVARWGEIAAPIEDVVAQSALIC